MTPGPLAHPPGQDRAPPDVDPRDLRLIQHWGHDVRHVLATLSDHLRLASRAGVAAPAQRNVEAALRQADAMARMIGAALEELTGAPRADPMLVPDEVLADIDQAFGHPQGPRLILNRDQALPPRIGIDRVSIERILRNLVGNALRHSGAQAVHVAMLLQGTDRLCLTVRDDGSGFPRHLLARQGEGAGLGLGIVALLVEELGGEWQMDNHLGGGAEVRIVLPFQPVQPPLAMPALTGPSGLSGLRILAVDDSATSLRILDSICRAEGMQIETVGSGEAAVERLRTQRFDLLIVDAHLPGRLSGAQVIRALRRHGPDVPALAITADTTATRMDELIAAGANRVLGKPLPDPAEVLRILDRLVRAAQPDTPAPLPPPQPPSLPDIPLFDPDPLTRVCSLAGPAMAREILDRLVQDMTETLAPLNAAALPLNVEALRAATHVLIALAGTAGAMRLLERSQALNRALHAGALTDVPAMLVEIRLLTEGAIAAIRRLPLPQGSRPQ